MTQQVSSEIHSVYSKTSIRSSKQNRTRIRTLGDVLGIIRDAGREGIVISNLSRKANLSYLPTQEQCSRLTLAGLIKPMIIDKRQVFVITEKGQEFFLEYQKFQDLVEPLNLKY